MYNCMPHAQHCYGSEDQKSVGAPCCQSRREQGAPCQHKGFPDHQSALKGSAQLGPAASALRGSSAIERGDERLSPTRPAFRDCWLWLLSLAKRRIDTTRRARSFCQKVDTLHSVAFFFLLLFSLAPLAAFFHVLLTGTTRTSRSFGVLLGTSVATAKRQDHKHLQATMLPRRPFLCYYSLQEFQDWLLSGLCVAMMSAGQAGHWQTSAQPLLQHRLQQGPLFYWRPESPSKWEGKTTPQKHRMPWPAVHKAVHPVKSQVSQAAEQQTVVTVIILRVRCSPSEHRNCRPLRLWRPRRGFSRST